MRYVTNALKASALAVPIGFAATTAQAADVVQTIQESERLSTFYQALQQANMLDVLRDDQPDTVFAPTNAAFEALPAETVEALFAPENQDALRTLLGYHIVQGREITSAELPEQIQTESGQLFIGLLEGAPVLARSEAYGASGAFPGGVVQGPVEPTAGAAVGAEQEAAAGIGPAPGAPVPDVGAGEGEVEAGITQDLATTPADELQDEAPLAQERAADEVTTTGTIGQDDTANILGQDEDEGGPETLTEMLGDDEGAEQEAVATAAGRTAYDTETVAGYFGEEPTEGARFVQADVEADNGVVHVIDYVLVPNMVIEEMLR